MHKKYCWLTLIALAIAIGGLVACDSGTSPSPVNIPVAVTADAPTAAPAPEAAPAAPATPGDITVQNIESTFDSSTVCTDLSQPEHSGKVELISRDLITNGTEHEAYAKPALFSTDQHTCAAHAANPASQSDLARFAQAPNVPAGGSGEWLHTLPLAEIFGSSDPADWCGSKQYDVYARNGEIARQVFGKVITSGRNCPNCVDANVRFEVKVLDASSGKVKITAKWRSSPYQGTHYKFKYRVDGGAWIREHASPFVKVITFGGNSGGHLIEWKIRVGNQDLAGCVGEERVTFRDVPQFDCDDINVQLNKSHADDTKWCFAGSWVKPPSSANLDYGHAGANTTVGMPFSNKCHTYPSPTSSEQTFTATLMVVRGSLECPATKTITIPPRKPRECRMQFSKTVDKTTVKPGEEFKWTVVARNVGDANCTGGGVQVWDTPEGYKYLDHVSFTSSGGCYIAGYGDGKNVKCNWGTMTPGETEGFTWKVRAERHGSCRHTIKNRAKLWSDQTGNIWTGQVSTYIGCGN